MYFVDKKIQIFKNTTNDKWQTDAKIECYCQSRKFSAKFEE